MVWIAVAVPAGRRPKAPAPRREASYAVWRHPLFPTHDADRVFSYGGLIAMQTLWAVPWMIKVCGYTAAQAATACSGSTSACWARSGPGVWSIPHLVRRGFTAERLIAWGLPFSFILLAIIVIAGDGLSTLATPAIALYLHELQLCFAGPSRPWNGVSQTLAGRALSAYNLVIFAGVFVVQWGSAC